MAMAATSALHANDYTTFLTTQRGFTEVTSTDGLIADNHYLYILAPAENTSFIVGIGRYEAKPEWAGDDTKALRYRSADTDPVLDLSNFFTIERSGQYIGFRNAVFSTHLFQTHDNAGYMYVLTYTEPVMSEWCYLTPTYQNGYWLFENGKYPISSNVQWKGYMGSWTAGRLADGEPIALNRTNEGNDVAGHYRLFRIAKSDLFLNTARGFTEVTATDDIQTGADHCYLLTSAEDNSLVVGIGRYEAKPGWASEETKALRYRSLLSDPALTLSNFFTIEKSGQYIGLRNMVYDTDLFQTHRDEGFMYVNTFTDKTLDEWSYLMPTFQDGYWLFENGKYPATGDAQWRGYMGPWRNVVKEGEPIALNRLNTQGDEAGHYRLLHISRNDLMVLRQQLTAASDRAPVEMTACIVNPSFETGDETGWVLNGKDVGGNDEFKTRTYGMTGRDGDYLMNAWQWWASSLSISQTATDIPAGIYELTATVASWEGRTVTLTANSAKAAATGVNDGTGVHIALTVTIDDSQRLTIDAGSTTDWWSEGMTENEQNRQCFFKIDDLRLKCQGFFLSAVAAQLPNDRTTPLLPDQWYYFDTPYNTQYWLIGQIDDMVYSTDGTTTLPSITTHAAARNLTLGGRVFFKTTRSNVTLQVVPERAVTPGTFKVAALNVDGLPNKIATVELNPDGPGADGTKKISQYLAMKNYDFIGVSEDFNYHGSLMESLNDNYSSGTVRKTLSLGDLPVWQTLQGNFRFDTDGLNLIWKNNKTSAANESWTIWNDMTSTDGNQYVKKGYRHYDMTIDNNVVIDVYVLHMDAGDTNATRSRESQWRQLADAINGSDHTRAKLIIGDTNSRYTREDVITNFIQRLSSDFSMGDAWVELYRNGIYPTTDMEDITDQSNKTDFSKYEVVDKIIYINPTTDNTVRLTPTSFLLEQDYTYGTIDGDANTTHLGDHEPLVVDFSYQMAGEIAAPAISLKDAEDNTAVLVETTGITANVTLQGRTLYKDGHWNTLCLPFSLNSLTGTPLEGATIMELDIDNEYNGHQTGFDASDGILYLYFKDVTAIQAGKPYIVKWEATDTNISDPTFSGITVTNTTQPATVVSADQNVGFIGTYAPAALTADTYANLYLDADDKLCYPETDGFHVNAFRAYFTVNLGNQAKVRDFVLGFNGLDANAIESITASPDGEGGWFDLSGRRLVEKPAQRGIYICNGKKVIIR